MEIASYIKAMYLGDSKFYQFRHVDVVFGANIFPRIILEEVIKLPFNISYLNTPFTPNKPGIFGPSGNLLVLNFDKIQPPFFILFIWI